MNISENGIVNLAFALSKFQEEVKNPSNTATNPQFRSKYAPLDVVINTVKPVLAKHGLSFIQSTGAEGENIIITTMLIHESGEYIVSDPLTLPAYQLKKGGEKDFNAQGAGSAITYGRRYSLSAMLGLSSEDDDDGNGQASGGGSGYKDSSNNPPKNTGGGMTDEEKERRKQEAIAKAQAKASANTGTTTPTPPTTESKEEAPSTTESTSVEKVNAGQLKAINNLLTVVSRKKGEAFDRDGFVATALSDYGVGELEDMSSDNAKDLITKINAEMRS